MASQQTLILRIWYLLMSMRSSVGLSVRASFFVRKSSRAYEAAVRRRFLHFWEPLLFFFPLTPSAVAAALAAIGGLQLHVSICAKNFCMPMGCFLSYHVLASGKCRVMGKTTFGRMPCKL